MTTTTPLPKRYGYKLPLEALGGACIRVSIEFPDKLEYRAAFNGSINMLGKWFQWDHTQADYQDIPELNVEVAQVWSEVLAAATWEECVEFCARMIECLLTDGDVQAAIATLISSNPAVQDALRDFVTEDPEINQHISDLAYEQAMSLAERGENILKPEACDPGFLFNQASVLVQLLHDLSEDIFEAIEVGTNQAERAQLLASGIPGVGLAPFDEIIGLADQLVEEIAEDYSGAYDEGLFDTIRCKIFCAIKDDCQLSLDKVIGVYEELFLEEIPSDPLAAFLAVIQYLSNGDLPTDAPVYAMHLLTLTAMRMSSEVLGIDFTRLALRVIAAGDESDNDWEILCEDCPPPPDTPNIIFGGTYYPSFDGTPKTFIENTPTGGSVWDVTYQEIEGIVAIAVTAQLNDFGHTPICVRIADITVATSYQHNLCDSPTQETGSGGGNPATEYGPNLGWYGPSAGTVTRITFEPI